MATIVGVRELKNSLSRYLSLAAGGESIVVCDHGHPVAILSPAPDGSQPPGSTAEHLAALAARGLVTLGARRRRRRGSKQPKVDLSGAILEDRDERS